MKGYEDVPCPHRQGGGGGKGDGPSKERKAINLVTFAGWKGFQDEDEEDDEFPDENKKPKRKVERGAGGIYQGFELFFDKNGSLLNAGQFKTVRRLVYLAQKSLDINIQFGDQDAVRLGDLIVSVEKLQNNSAKYIGKSLLLFGKPTSIKSGNARHFFNFQSPGHEVSMHCDPRIVKDREWKSYERDHYYIFYGLIEGTVAHTTIKILEPGQIDRLPTTARDLFNSLR
ncbi:hypothetical protein K5D48_09550 [Pseudomonas cichorii]|nr:hypothetical protein [Pseudomonas cichorii]